MKTESAPALENGITIVELLSRSVGPVGFNAIDSALNVSRGTTARLLKVLQVRGWVARDTSTGKYLLGDNLFCLSRTRSTGQVLVDTAKRLLPELQDEAENSCLVILWDGRIMECVAKETHIQSIPLQMVGNVVQDLSHAPWGWIIYESLSAMDKKAAEKHFHYGEAMKSALKSDGVGVMAGGFAYDPQLVIKNVRRLGAVIRDRSGAIAGAVGIGGNQLTIKNGRVRGMGKLLLDYAQRFSDALAQSQ